MAERDAALVAAGRIGRPHGLDGSFHVTRPRGRLLVLGGTVDVDGTPRRIERRDGTVDKPILRLEGIGDREALDAVRGRDVRVSREDLPDLDEDEFWPEDLVGLAVRGLDGTPVGEVKAVLDLPSCDVLEVAREGRADLLVPLVRDAVPELAVDAEDPAIVVDLAFLGEED